MDKRTEALLYQLADTHTLAEAEYLYLLTHRTEETEKKAASLADAVRRQHYGNAVYIRGLIEISNICQNDCLYCGIRASNRNCDRYRLTTEEILTCAHEGYELGFRTFVLQGGEDGYFTDARLADLLYRLKSAHPDCAVTLSLGERSRDSYRLLREAGADRYLLRHETADTEHYARLHPAVMSHENRMRCLENLYDLGYQVGCGFMVGSPDQTEAHLARELVFLGTFRPHMCGIGPFIPHKDTEFASYPAGSVGTTCYLLSLIRMTLPTVLLPATTALGTLAQDGRERGIAAGANVVMPNLSPESVRAKYALYDGKLSSGAESAQALNELRHRMTAIGYTVVTDRGDAKTV